MTDLIAIGYPDEETAQKVWQELVRLEKDYLVDLDDAAIIRRDSAGKLHVTTPAHHAVAWGTLSGLFWGTLIGLLLLFPLAPLAAAAGGLMGAVPGQAAGAMAGAPGQNISSPNGLPSQSPLGSTPSPPSPVQSTPQN